MSQNFLNLCYNIAGKREIRKKLREDARYSVLQPGSPSYHSHGRPTGRQESDDNKKKVEDRYSMLYGGSPSRGHRTGRDESDDDSSPRRTNKKPSILNKIFKKAKNSDDEDDSNCVHELADMVEQIAEEQPRESDAESSPEMTSVFNRKKKRYLSLSGDIKKNGSRKHPGWAKIRPAPGIPVRKVENSDQILKEFDPLWAGEGKNEVKRHRVHNYEEIDDLKTLPPKPPRNKINKTLVEDQSPVIQENEVKVAKVDFIQENENSATEQVVEQPNKDVKPEHILVNAEIRYESMEGALHTPVVRDASKNVNESGVRIVNASDGEGSAVIFNKAEAVEDPNVCALCKAPKKPNVAPVDVQEVKDEAGAASIEQLDNEKNAENAEPNKDAENMTEEEKQRLEDERQAAQFIAQFFSEKARDLTDDDITNYSKTIKINKIEIYAEDVKRYYEGLKYCREPVEHDIVYITVSTALEFIQKLVKEREDKKKYRFIPDMLEKCFKSKAKREAEAKKREEEKKKKDKLRPKMWLVYNRINQEKVIICTPGEFYDSE